MITILSYQEAIAAGKAFDIKPYSVATAEMNNAIQSGVYEQIGDLQSNIQETKSILEASDNFLANAVALARTDLTTAFQSADAILLQRINSVEADYKASDVTLAGVITSVQQGLQAADVNLVTQIGQAKADVTAAFQTADTVLDGKIADLENSKINKSVMGVPNGVATLDTNGQIPSGQLPSFVDDILEFNTLTGFPVTGESGKIYVAKDTNKQYRWSGSSYQQITSGAVDSVAGKTGIVVLVKSDVGLGNVDNTADSAKNVLSATKLTTARTISTTGDATGSTSFDGSANVSIAITLANSGVIAGSYPVVTVNSKGLVTGGRALTASDIPVLNQDTTGNAGSATKLATARTISLTGDGTASMSFDGSGNATSVLTLANSGVTAGDYPVVTVNSKGIVTGGRALTASDIPVLNQNTTGNAATATVAVKANTLNNPQSGGGMTFNWSGQAGQPSWLWGSNDGTNIYVYNPVNFSVANANTWSGSSKTTSAAAPSGGVNGDIWFQYA